MERIRAHLLESLGRHILPDVARIAIEYAIDMYARHVGSLDVYLVDWDGEAAPSEPPRGGSGNSRRWCLTRDTWSLLVFGAGGLEQWMVSANVAEMYYVAQTPQAGCEVCGTPTTSAFAIMERPRRSMLICKYCRGDPASLVWIGDWTVQPWWLATMGDVIRARRDYYAYGLPFLPKLLTD